MSKAGVPGSNREELSSPEVGDDGFRFRVRWVESRGGFGERNGARQELLLSYSIVACVSGKSGINGAEAREDGKLSRIIEEAYDRFDVEHAEDRRLRTEESCVCAVELRSRRRQVVLRAKPKRASDHLRDLAELPEEKIFLR